MYIEKEFEANYEQEIKKFSLHFKNKDLESEYMNCKINMRKIPLWFKISLWSLVVYYAIRRVQAILFVIIKKELLVRNADLYGETTLLIIWVLGVTGEIISYYIVKLSITRGFWIMAMWNVIVPYSSWYYFPKTLALIPTSGSAYVFNVLASTWLINTWFASFASSIIGLILTTVFINIGESPSCKLK